MTRTTIQRFSLWAFVLAAVWLCGAMQVQAQPELRKATSAEILDTVAQNDAQITVVNFWATWCVPCIEEFPYFVRLGKEFGNQGVKVLFVSTDFPDEEASARQFLAKQGVTEPQFMKDEKTNAFVNAFHTDWSGAIPATFVYDEDGQLLDFWEGKATYEQLTERITSHL